jgi:hypothetical protein
MTVSMLIVAALIGGLGALLELTYRYFGRVALMAVAGTVALLVVLSCFGL